MTEREALKLALELLAVGTFHSPELQAKRTEVIEKGLNALAQPEQEPVAIYQYQMGNGSWIDQDQGSYRYNKQHGHTVRIVYTTPPQRKEPEQEPVPDLYVKDINGNFHSYKEKGHTVSSQCVPPSHVGVGEDDFTPHRKPLTEQQIVDLCDGTLTTWEQVRIARAIEAAHGIKE